MTKIELTRRRILGGLVTIGAGSAAAGAGTFALFSDTDTPSTESLSAGTLDLTVGNSGTIEFSQDNIYPEDSGTATADVSQSGTLPAERVALSQIEVTSVSSKENGLEEPEESDSDNDGELKDQLKMDIWITDDPNNTTYDLEKDGTVTQDGSEGRVTATEYHDGTDGDGTTWGTSDSSDDVIPNFGGATFEIDWKFPDLSDQNNAAQGDSLTVEFKFLLEQRQQ